MTIRAIGWSAGVLAFVGVFAFPWLLTRMLMGVAALAFPPSAVLIGIVADLVHYPGTGLPVGLVWGAGIAIAAVGVRSFVQNRMLLP